MIEKKKIIISWSGGKDSALALHEIKKSNNYEIVGLLTTVTEDYDRISMHGVRRVLLERQAALLGLPLIKIGISKGASNDEYEHKMKEVLLENMRAGVTTVAFGDIFLDDLKKYRENNLARIGMEGFFPIWKRDTEELARAFIDLGFKAITTCIDSQILDKSFVGKTYDRQFLSSLPTSVDPCGENGEFHSFVYDGPIFKKNIEVSTGQIVLRDNRFYFCDLIPSDNNCTKMEVA